MPIQPNILLILTAQHRLSALGAYGETPCRTPNLDRLAREGVRFETAYTTCPVCSPARASILTGLYPHLHGVTTNIWELGCNVSECFDRPSLLPRRLQSAGYSLGYTGKWHLGTANCLTGPQYPHQEATPTLPKDVGFEGQNFPGHGGGGQAYPEFREYLQSRNLTHNVTPLRSGSCEFQWAGIVDAPVEATEAYFLAEYTISLLDDFRQRERPFFLWHNFWGPHAPYWVPQEYLDLYRDAVIPPWPNYEWPPRETPGPHRQSILPQSPQMEWSDWAELIRHYYAFTTMIDEQIGRIYRHLEESGLLENTVVIFAADHGESLGDHGGIHNKGWTHFEETLRIPLIIRFPDGTGAGTVRPEFASLADLYPTILDCAGALADDGLHGASLLPLLRNENVEWREDVKTEFHGLGGLPFLQRTLRRGSLKYGYNGVMEDELYDLECDPHEMVNRVDSAEYSEALTDLRHRLLRWMEKHGDQAMGEFQRTAPLTGRI